MEDLKTLFSNNVQRALSNFNHKMEQSKLFQVQQRFAEIIIQKAKENELFVERLDALTMYDETVSKLDSTGKTYKNVLEEKLFTDGFRVFEEFLSDIFFSIFNVFPNLLLAGTPKDKDGKIIRQITVPFDYIFTTPNIEGCQSSIIESKVKSFLQGDNITTILDRFKTTFDLTMEIDNKKDKDIQIQKVECQRHSLLRNIITHNNSVINTIYINSISKFGIQGNSYKLEDSILSYLNEEIMKQRITLNKIAESIAHDLDKDDNLKKLDERNKNI